MPRHTRSKPTDSPDTCPKIDLHQALANLAIEAATLTLPLPCNDLPSVPRPYSFENLGWKPLVNYIPNPTIPPAPLTDSDFGWLD